MRSACWPEEATTRTRRPAGPDGGDGAAAAGISGTEDGEAGEERDGDGVDLGEARRRPLLAARPLLLRRLPLPLLLQRGVPLYPLLETPLGLTHTQLLLMQRLHDTNNAVI